MITAAFLGTIIPIMFLVVILHNSRPVMSTFAWGMVSFILAYHANSFAGKALGLSDNIPVMAVLVAPVIEEFFKLLPLVYFLFLLKPAGSPFFSILGMAAGIGFAIEENLLYLLNHQAIIGVAPFYIVIRSVSTCLVHGVSTALVGLTFIFIKRRRGIGILLAIPGYLGAVALHGSYNFLVGYINTSVALMLPLAFYLAAWFAIRHYSINMLDTEINCRQW